MPGEVRPSENGSVAIDNRAKIATTNDKNCPTPKDIDDVYVNLLDKFDPAARRVSDAGHLFVKALQGVENAERVYVDALQHVIKASDSASHPQSKNAGQYLSEICDILSNQHKDFTTLLTWYTSQLLSPLSQNVKTDGGALTELQKLFKKNFKAIQKELQKGKKNGMRVEELNEELAKLQRNAYNHAMMEERKRYNFIMERHASFMKNVSAIGNKANTLNEGDEPGAVQEAFSFLDEQTDDIQVTNQSIDSDVPRSERSTSTNTNQSYNQPKVQPNPSDIIYLSSKVDEQRILPESPDTKWVHEEKRNDESEQSSRVTSFSQSNPVSTSRPVSVNTQTYHSMQDSQDSGSDVVPPLYAVVQKRPVSSFVPAPPPLPANARPMLVRSSTGGNTNNGPPLPIVPKPKEPPQQKQAFVLAMHPFAPTADNQVPLTPGEKLVILSHGNKQGWIFGESTVSKLRGWFPENYTRPFNISLVSPSSSTNSSSITDASTSESLGSDSSPGGIRSSPFMQVNLPNQNPVVVPVNNKKSHVTNYDTIPKNNPFSHVRLRPVITDNETPRKYL